MTKIQRPTFRAMADRWPSTLVARHEISRFTGGLVSPGYLANLDAARKGPTGRIRIGRKVAYSVDELVDWLESRSSVI